jgi:hypothetical protein
VTQGVVVNRNDITNNSGNRLSHRWPWGNMGEPKRSWNQKIRAVLEGSLFWGFITLVLVLAGTVRTAALVGAFCTGLLTIYWHDPFDHFSKWRRYVGNLVLSILLAGSLACPAEPQSVARRPPIVGAAPHL